MSVFKQFQVRIGYYAAFGGISLISLCSVSEAALFGVSPRMFNRRTNEMTKSTQKQFAENEIKVTGLEARIGKVETNISAQAQAVAKVQAGYDRSQTQAAGRDITTTTTNDSRLMEQIFKGLSALFLTVIGFMSARIKDLAVENKYLVNSRKKYQDRFLKLLSPEYNKLVGEESGTGGGGNGI